MGKAVALAFTIILFSSDISKEIKNVSLLYLSVTGTYFLTTEAAFDDNSNMIKFVKWLHVPIMDDLEHLWVPTVTKAAPIALSGTFMCLCIMKGTVGISPGLVMFYTNIYLPFETWCFKQWIPLQQERRFAAIFRGEKKVSAQCPICLEDTLNAVLTPCQHPFHSFCLRRSIEMNGATCPICRRNLN